VPVTHMTRETCSSDETWDVLGQLYTRCHPGPGSGPTTLTATSWQTPGLSWDTVHIPGGARAAAEGVEQVTLVACLGGHVDLDFHRTDRITGGPGDCYVAVPGTRYSFTFDTLDVMTVRMPLDGMDRAAHELTGLERGGLRFLAARPVAPGYAHTWTATASMVRDYLHSPDDPVSHPLVHQQLVDAVVAAALSVFPNTAMLRGYVPGPGDTRPTAVRRAVAYIDAHASLPITLTDIAGASGTTAWALRAAFRRHLRTTPMAYLRRVRLDGAHQDLRAASPGRRSGVLEIAARWGFGRLDGFTAAYLAEYGCLPSVTLER
jgi:AraC-like DNA-binding protein